MKDFLPEVDKQVPQDGQSYQVPIVKQGNEVLVVPPIIGNEEI